MARHVSHLIPLLLLLLLTVIARSVCQSTISLGYQDPRDCTLPGQRNIENRDVGTNFSVTCLPECINSSLAIQSPGREAVYGTRVYSLDSDLCLAAVHDARLPHPSRMAGPTAVLLTPVHYGGTFVASFRRGVSSASRAYKYQQLGVQFTSDWVQEAVPDITTVHTNFRRERGPAYVRCHVGSPYQLSEAAIYRVSGGQAKADALNVDADNDYVSLTHNREKNDPPEVFLCRLKASAYSDTTTFAYSPEPYFEPIDKMYWSSAGSDVTIGSLPSLGAPTWFGAGFRGITRQGTGLLARELTFTNVRLEQSGVYLMAYNQEYRSYSSATRLVVRACPENFFGAACDRRCPHCLHGGRCHEATGQCVCPPGFIGFQCEIGCGESLFGMTCSWRCPPDDCRGRLLCAPDPYGCSCGPGWGGNDCSRGCPQGSYGPDCAFQCGHCRYSSCDKFTGRCDQGCIRNDVSPPLCQESQWPWFRDPPEILTAEFTSITIRHRRWTRRYDNGNGNGSLLTYIGQIREADGGRPWSSDPAGAGVRDDSLAGDEFQLKFGNLKPDTSYLVRIVIREMPLNAQQDSDELIPYQEAVTDCEAPNSIGGILTNELTDTSATFTLEDISNKQTACAYKLNVTLSAQTADGAGSSTRLIDSARSLRVQFTGLTPFTDYTLTVFAVSRKGSSPPHSEVFRTLQGAPSQVTQLQHFELLPGRFSIAWNEPTNPNGIIGAYQVLIQHLRFTACGTSTPQRDATDVLQINTTELGLEVPLKHNYSVYSVSVIAFTVVAGDIAFDTIRTGRTVPGVTAQVSVTEQRESVYLTWTWPGCSTWGDDAGNIRLLVTIRGVDQWNQGSRVINYTTPGSYIYGLTPFSNYVLIVGTCNSVGCNQTMQEITFETLESEPGIPVNVTGVGVAPTTLTIGWDPPVPPLSRIASYTVCWNGCYYYYQLPVSADEACSHSRPRCRAKITGLREDTEYSVTVYATSADEGSGHRSIAVRLQTGEGAPGLPRDLRFTNRSQTMLNVSWLEPEEKNGRLLQFRLNVSADEPGSGRRLRRAAGARTFTLPARQRDGRQLNDDTPYSQLVEGLSPGTAYRLEVAASTSAGFGSWASVVVHTLVAAPTVREQPRVVPERTTDTTVQLVLPAAESGGGPLSSYLVLVATAEGFDAVQVVPSALPNAEESEKDELGFYVTAALEPERVQRDSTFVVGDGRYYNSTETPYLNQPLTTGDKYWFGVAVLSRIDDDNEQLAFQQIGEPIVVLRPPASPVLPVLLAFLSLALFVLLVAAIAYRKRIKSAIFKNSGNRNEADVPLEDVRNLEKPVKIENEDMEDEEAIYANEQPMQINFTRIELKDLAERVRADVASGQLMAQLQNVPHGLTRPCTRGQLAENKHKNRYINLLPYDESRVVLEKVPGDDFSDYINANFVEGYNRPRGYIACQGPKKETKYDFWRMVWQEKVARIVMVTNLVEGGKRKCDEYWPTERRLRLPGMKVSLEMVQEYSDFIVRTFSINHGNLNRVVTQFHYTAWPDHSVPLYPSSLAKFIRTVNGVNDQAAPTVVHCSAGVGRTGTVILIDSMYQMGQREQAVDVASHLAVIRQQRANLCANLAQYQLVHQVLVELLVSPSMAVPAAQLAARLPQLRAPGPAGGPSQVEQQLSYLEQHRPVATHFSLGGLQLEGKNRSPDVLPDDSSRVFLDPKIKDNYINAVFVQGYKRQDAFIATEAPLPARKYVFWQMVVQKRSRIIVVMNDLEEEDVFWPTEGQADVYRDVEVQSSGETASDGIITISLKILCFESGQMTETIDVTVLVLAGAEEGGARRRPSLPRAAELLQLYSAYMRSAAPLGALPAVVVCRNGVSGCGLFLTVCFELEHLSEEQELDVAMAVSVVRRSRPQFITGLEQYQLCYDVALSWLDAFATYANFQ
ncbi:receptor-type tyrosine-protein phosphatase T-like isoform X1 [Amphibalanus amphitrite]|uniref:receptor-type tyrosine-protein phosphatase T-like isoform X1 n=1 Tax=Amphibalanus amphitrite TaxID=1232801 RepID=UPI001C914562|nr:receptor-type tyrosine-protein phosphatase T-like isoform X1 [Amphibalanus amphitrite]